MELALLLVAAGVGGSIAMAFFRSQAWKEVGEELGLRYASTMKGPTLIGRISGFTVRIARPSNDNPKIQVEVSGGDLPVISLETEGFFGTILGSDDIEVGCAEFDADALVRSGRPRGEAKAVALLDAKTRDLVTRRIVRGDSKLDKGKIVLQTTKSIRHVTAVVERQIKLAEALKITNDEIPGRLARNSAEDPISLVRLRNLTLLQERYADQPEATDASRASLESETPSIRLAAAIFLGDEAVEVVREIALDERADADVRAKALEGLKKDPERMAVYTKLLGSDSALVQQLAARGVGRSNDPAHLASLEPLLDSSVVTLVLEAVQAMVKIGDSSAETVLIPLLDHKETRVRMAVIEALGRLGTVRSVEPLFPLTKSFGYRRQARGAIDSIQARLGDVEAGRLTLSEVEDPEGAISLAGSGELEGGVSFAGDDEDEDPKRDSPSDG